jgi:hypothetical protein
MTMAAGAAKAAINSCCGQVIRAKRGRGHIPPARHDQHGRQPASGSAAFSAQGAATVVVGTKPIHRLQKMTGAASISWVGASTSTGSNVTLWGEVRRRQADRIRRIEQEDEELLRLVREAIAPAIIERLRKAA